MDPGYLVTLTLESSRRVTKFREDRTEDYPDRDRFKQLVTSYIAFVAQC